MKVLIIPEDQTLDGFVAKPVIEAIFGDLGISARVAVLPEPRLRGANDALDQTLIAEIVAENPMEDLFLLIVDRDCDRDKATDRAKARESEHPSRLLACVAIEELEVWLLALHRDQISVGWSMVRRECDPKERWAEPLLKQIGTGGPGGGRKKAMGRLSGQLKSLMGLCDEVGQLRERIRTFVQGRRGAD